MIHLLVIALLLMGFILGLSIVWFVHLYYMAKRTRELQSKVLEKWEHWQTIRDKPHG